MAFNINDFKNNGLVWGGARPSLFKVTLTPPSGVDFTTQNFAEKIEFTCQASSIPASSVASFDVPYFGRKIKLAGDRTFADWNVTIMNDEDFGVRDFFEEWSQNINSNETNIKRQPQNAYKSADAIVTQYSKSAPGDNGLPIAAYKFIGIFPTDISAMELNWDSTNSVQTFNVTFAYDYYINARTDLGESSGINLAEVPRIG
jgi:hypothetical protein